MHICVLSMGPNHMCIERQNVLAELCYGRTKLQIVLLR